MNNKKIIQKALGHKLNNIPCGESQEKLGALASNNEGSMFSVMKALTWSPKSNDNTLRKAKAFPSATTIWSNSIYSFNKNYLKNIPAVDNIVNKIIKSFFTINALANNPKGLKSRLVQRRYKRLSLNKILVSKSEIKHTNDKVFITVYLFNKKKRSLLLKLKDIYNSLSFRKSFSSTMVGGATLLNKDIGLNLGASPINTAFKSKGNITSFLENIDPNNTKSLGQKNKSSKGSLPSRSKYILWNKYNNKMSYVGGALTSYNKSQIIDYKGALARKNVEVYNSIKNTKLLNHVFFNKYAFVELISRNNNNFKKRINNTHQITSASQAGNSSFLNNVLYYNNLNYLTKHNIGTFINSLHRDLDHKIDNNNLKEINKSSKTLYPLDISLNIINKDLGINLKNLFKNVNKYKLYNSVLYNKAFSNSVLSYNNLFGLGNRSQESLSNYNNPYTGIHFSNLRKPNYSIYKLKSMYKLFTLYNNINLGASDINTYEQNINGTYSKKILLNTYKLLRKSYVKLSLKGNEIGLNNFDINGISKLKSLGHKNNSSTNKGVLATKKNTLETLDQKNSKSYINLRNTMKSVILMNKLNRIDKFFNKYKNILLQNQENISVNNTIDSHISSQIISTYKIGFINELLEKELLYIYYLKLLSYNNALFKNWFLYSLKNLISKIYNKKVILNLINLKYIHLNSDILSEAVNIRLRNFKKNRVVKVLKKVIKLVPISKVNIYACDEHSPVYKYVHNYYNKFKDLKLDIFKELGLFSGGTQETNNLESLARSRNSNKGPCSIKRLNHVQASTINFIKYKSVFGVRLEAAGRLTKRSTASRSVFKFRYNGTLRNNPVVNNSISSVIIKDNRISNLQFTQITSKTRNGSFGIKGWINNN